MSLQVKRTTVATIAVVFVTLVLSALTSSESALAFQSTKSLYASKCAVCHANDGSGSTAKGKELKVRAFNAPEFKKMPDDKALEIMLKGKGKMEGYEKTLGKEKCVQLLAYCRELSNK